MAEDQLAQVSGLEGSRQQGRSDKAGQDTFDINQIVLDRTKNRAFGKSQFLGCSDHLGDLLITIIANIFE